MVRISDETFTTFRLLDMSVDDKPQRKVPSLLQNIHPYNLYKELNSIKNDLIRGLSLNEDDNDRQSSVSSSVNYNTPWSVSRPTSTISKTLSTSDFESEDDWNASVDTANNVIETLRNHLIKIHFYLNSLTNTATLITECYNNEHTS